MKLETKILAFLLGWTIYSNYTLSNEILNIQAELKTLKHQVETMETTNGRK